LRPKLNAIPAANLFLQAVQDIRVGGRGSNSQYQYTLRADNLKDLTNWSERLLEQIRTLPQIRDPNTDQQARGLQLSLIVDRDTAARLGISAAQVDKALYDAFGQRQVSTMYAALNQYHVVMEVDPKFQQSPDALKDIY